MKHLEKNNLGLSPLPNPDFIPECPKLSCLLEKRCVCVCVTSNQDLSMAKSGKANLSAFRQLCIIILRHLPWPPSVCSMLHAMKNDDVVPSSDGLRPWGQKLPTSSTSLKNIGKVLKSSDVSSEPILCPANCETFLNLFFSW